MNFTIIGNDGKRYGPVGAEQLRQWIKQSRVESRTPVFIQGSADWTFLGLLPEFAAGFPENAPAITPPKPGPPHVPAAPASQLAIWGFVCGLLGWTCCGCCVPFDLLGLTFSIIALVQINARTEPLTGRGFAIAGIVLSASNLGLTFMGMLGNSLPVQWNLGNVVSGGG
ncbi:MAG TPA: DUF4190 domain-containing protein [Candidatus Acidoferrales bacterium]|jgi:hypothetical protein|nr:DUF4190 domain-containing protein [Candidatus Acidoferrales bacterium]